MSDGKNLIAKVPLSWKKTFSQGVIIPQKMKNCGNWKKDILCESCDSLNLNELKRERPNDFGHMLPKYITT